MQTGASQSPNISKVKVYYLFHSNILINHRSPTGHYSLSNNYYKTTETSNGVYPGNRCPCRPTGLRSSKYADKVRSGICHRVQDVALRASSEPEANEAIWRQWRASQFHSFTSIAYSSTAAWLDCF